MLRAFSYLIHQRLRSVLIKGGILLAWAAEIFLSENTCLNT